MFLFSNPHFLKNKRVISLFFIKSKINSNNFFFVSKMDRPSGTPTLKRRFDNNEQENESKKLNLSSTEEQKIQILR